MSSICTNHLNSDIARKCSINAITRYDNNLLNYYIDTLPVNQKEQKYTSNNINLVLDDNKDYPYSFCSYKKKNYFENCALTKKSPWFTANNINTRCQIPTNIKLPENFQLNQSNYEIITPDIEELAYKNNIAFCETRFYDWFTIKYYHLGNNYYPDANNSNNNNILYNCYKPCENNYIPYIDGDNNVCIPFNTAENGIYYDNLPFTPLAFIEIIGANYKDLFNLFKTNLFKEIKNNEKYIYDSNLINSFFESLNYDQNINHITKFNKIYYDCFNGIYNAIDNIVFKNADLDYNHPYLKEPSNETMNIMYKNNLFDYDILNHVYNIAYRYNSNYDNNIDYTTNANYLTYIKSISPSINGLNINISNILNTNDKKDFQYFIKEGDTLYNLDNLKLENFLIINWFEYDKKNITDAGIDNAKKTINVLNSILKDDYLNKIIILCNIFRKASNICFDNKTSFSKYIFSILNNNSSNYEYKPFEYNKFCKNTNNQNIINPDKTINPNEESNIKSLPFSEVKYPNVYNMIMNFIFIILFLFMIYIIIIIISSFKTIFYYILNNITIFFRNLGIYLYYIFDHDKAVVSITQHNLKNITKIYGNIIPKIT